MSGSIYGSALQGGIKGCFVKKFLGDWKLLIVILLFFVGFLKEFFHTFFCEKREKSGKAVLWSGLFFVFSIGILKEIFFFFFLFKRKEKLQGKQCCGGWFGVILSNNFDFYFFAKSWLLCGTPPPPYFLV
jgi:hypothetical protein